LNYNVILSLINFVLELPSQPSGHFIFSFLSLILFIDVFELMPIPFLFPQGHFHQLLVAIPFLLEHLPTLDACQILVEAIDLFIRLEATTATMLLKVSERILIHCSSSIRLGCHLDPEGHLV
jgi:hypothetical protein